MVKKKSVSFLEKKVSNRLAYTIIAAFALILVGVGVYAVVPSPVGHAITELEACSDGQILKTSGSAWICGTDSVGVSSQWVTSGSNIYYSDGNVGIGTSSPTAKLSVNGSVLATSFTGDGSGLTSLIVRVQGADPVCDSTKDGLLRYKGNFCSADDIRSSSYDICMRTGSTTYAWHNLKTYTWTDASCDTNGCPSGQQYYECTGYAVAPGCYTSEPTACFCTAQTPSCEF